jgi:protein phosphatase 1 regulatory subunit 7
VIFTKRQIRINDPVDLDVARIDAEIRDDKHVIVQFSDNVYTDSVLTTLNTLCETYDEHFAVRFYGHYSGSFDFKTLLKIPRVKSLYVDCLTRADNILTLTELTELKLLSLGVFESKETEILKLINSKRLTALILTETRSKAINLEYISDYKQLQSVIIGDHSKNIGAIGELTCLEFLSLNSIKKTPVNFVNKLKNLKTLKFILGGRENFDEIEENEIENLDVVWVRGFNSLNDISRFKKLKKLLIEDNIQLPKVHFDKVQQHLTDLKILNCRTLGSLAGLENLPSLTQLRIYKTNLDFNDVIKQKLPPNLKTFAFYTTKKKIDDEIKRTLQSKGYTEW